MATEWERFRQEQERLRREAEAQARQREQQRLSEEHQRLHNEARARERLEQLRRDALALGQESVRKLDQEAREIHLLYGTHDSVAESIKRSWESEGATVQVSPIQRADVELNDDGTLKRNRSFAGVNISYSYHDIAPKIIESGYVTGSDGDTYEIKEQSLVTQSQQLKFGIGFFETTIMPPPQDDFWRRLRELYPQDPTVQWYRDGYVGTLRYKFPKMKDPISSEENAKGVKAYFIDKGYSIYAMPERYTGSKADFYTELDIMMEKIRPSIILPQAARRIRQSPPGTRI